MEARALLKAKKRKGTARRPIPSAGTSCIQAALDGYIVGLALGEKPFDIKIYARKGLTTCCEPYGLLEQKALLEVLLPLAHHGLMKLSAWLFADAAPFYFHFA